MDFVKDVTLGEVLEGLHRENSGSKSYAWAENRLKQADGLCIGRWALVILDKADIANIVLPAHRHGIELVPDSGLAVSATAEVLRSLRLHLYTRQVAGTHTPSKHNPIIVCEVVVKAERIQVSPLGNREISNQTIQRHVGRRHKTGGRWRA